MIDPALLRNDPDLVRATLTHRGMDLDVDALIDLEQRRRKLRASADELRAQQKSAGQSSALRRSSSPGERLPGSL